MNKNCIVCNRDHLRPIRKYRTNTKYGRAVFGLSWLHECEHCGVVQVSPLPDREEWEEYYKKDYRRLQQYGSDVANAKVFPKDNLFYLNRGYSSVELISRYLNAQTPEILDIGAGYGHILHAIAKQYPQCHRTAIEFSQVCVQHLHSIGLDVFSEPAEQFLSTTGLRFDLVTLSHVLEHLCDPCGIVKMISERLVPGGLLYVEVPNIPSESLLRFPDHIWAPRYDEPHIVFFSMLMLRRLLESVGLTVEICETAGPKYRDISAVHFKLPPLRWLLQDLTPKPLFLFLRGLRMTRQFRVKEHDESFYQYGGYRIWLRAIARKDNGPIKSLENPSFVVNEPIPLP